MSQFSINAARAGILARALASLEDQLLNSSPKQADTLETQHDLILNTISQSFTQPKLQEKAVQLFIDIFPILERWGCWNDYIPTAEEALALNLPPLKQCHIHLNLGRVYELNRNKQDALVHLNQSLALAQSHNLDDLFGLIHHRFMNAYWRLEENQKAREHGLKALHYLGETPSTTLAAAYNSLGNICTNLGEYPEAEEYLWEALSLWDSLKDYTNMAKSYHNLGILFNQQNNPADAQKCFETVLKAIGDVSHSMDRLKAINGLGTVHYSMGNLEKAREIFQQGVDDLQHKEEWYNLRGILNHNLGNTLLAQGHLQPARFYLKKSIADCQQTNDDLRMGNTVGTLAETYEAEGIWHEAVRYYDEALTILAQFPDHAWAIKLTKNFTKAKAKCANQLATTD